ncbi:LTA synthase family protein [Cetobacterium somerae]|uniref:LTA synthase family protein n=1 Tax=Cetobacterium sp. NK01 TaxID=2993530 RepID=UPI002115DEDD|nr:LTA synthase family protein [Cetobacterium sp. NK01]MCQ8213555.1 LTA synthase family protein [Cetobacterium sp. NK01]
MIRKRQNNCFKIFGFFIQQYIYLYLMMLFSRVYFLKKTFPSEIKIPRDIIYKGFKIGWIFDNSIIGSFTVISSILFLGFYILNKKFNKLAKLIYLIPIASLFTVICAINIANIEYFKEFGFNVNSSIINYLGDTDEILATTFSSAQYSPIANLLIILFFTFGFLILTKKNLEKFNKKLEFNLLSKLKEIITLLLIITIGVFSSRGGFSEAVLDWGRGYYSEYSYMNQFTINPVFSLGRSYYNLKKEQRKGRALEKTFSNEELNNNIREIIDDKNSKYISKTNPLLRVTNTEKEQKNYNVVIVLMESFMSKYIGIQGAQIDMTPNFNKLAKEGVLFNNFYATGTRSNRGIASVIVSYPSPKAISVTKEFTAGQKSFFSLPKILKERGYNTSFIYGGDAEFDNMSGFLKLNGVDNIIDIKNFSKEDRTIKWGVPDDKLFKKTVDYLDSLKDPFFTTVFTLSNHAPYDIDSNYKLFKNNEFGELTNRLNAFHFADIALGEFIKEVKKKEWATNTIFVFVADHGFKTDSNFDLNWENFRVPLLLWSPGNIFNAKIDESTSSQVDILPTLMGLLGGEYKNSSWGRDLFKSSKKNEYAYIMQNNFYGVVKDDVLLIDGDGVKPKLVDIKNSKYLENNEILDKLDKVTRTYLELETYQLKNGTFAD